MAVSDRMLEKGDWVVHHLHGVGQIKGVVKRKVNGKKQMYYRVQTNDLTYYLQVSEDHIKEIRSVSAPSTFRSMLSLIRKEPKQIAEHHRTRKKRIQKAATKLSLKAKARMIRDLYGRQIRKKLNFRDQMTLEKLKKQFVAEWAVSDEKLDKEEAMRKLNDALYTSATRMEAE